MIVFDRATLRRAPLALQPLSQSLDAGVHALVGAPGDGVGLVLALAAGRARPRRGAVRVLDGAPSDPEVRTCIAYVPLDARVPETLTVAETLAVAARIRGEERRDATERLGALGLEALAPRRGSSLARDEARGVLLAEAVTSRRVRVLLVEEPYVRVDPRAQPLVSGALRGRASDGVCAVVTTASPRDAADLADVQLYFDRGVLVRRAGPGDPIVSAGPQGFRLRILASNARALLVQLATDAAIASLETTGTTIVASGDDLLAVAAAVGRAAARTQTDIEDMRPELPPLEEARAAASGAAAAYHAALERASRSPTPPAGAQPSTGGGT